MNDNPYSGPVDQPGLPGEAGKNWIRRFFFYAISAAAILLVLALFLPGQRNVREAASRSRCKSNLKEIGVALHRYHEIHGAFPPPYTMNASGQKLHSWRTLILPFLDQQALYDRIDLNKPWNDPVNNEACSAKVDIYRCPSANTKNTTYLAILGPDFAFDPLLPRKAQDFKDNASDTLLVIEATPEQAVPWASPQDADEEMVLGVSAESKLTHTGGMHVLLADGSARFCNATTPGDVRRALLTIAGGEKISGW